MIKLSIVVPVYNVEKYLERCINSIINQTFNNFELILVDDGSVDRSGEICDRLALNDNRIKVIHQKNGGLGFARNVGISVAEGEYIAFVDSDDWITMDMYEYLIEKSNHYNADIVATSYVLTKGSGTIPKIKEEINVYSELSILKFYLKSGMSNLISDYTVCNKIYRRILFNDIKFPESQLYEDGVTNYKLLKKANLFVKSNKITYFYFQDGDSITRNQFTNKDFDILKVGKQFVELANIEEDIELINLAKMKEARAYLSMLSKIAVYGIDESIINKKEVKNKLKRELRRNTRILLNSPMPTSRKILTILLGVNVNVVTIPLKLINSMR